MTRTEKLKAINDRLGGKIPSFKIPEEISVMMIADILGTLAAAGLIETPYSISKLGKNVVSICEEFEWEITDADIQMFCEDMVPPDQVEAITYFIKASRDGTLGITNG